MGYMLQSAFEGPTTTVEGGCELLSGYGPDTFVYESTWWCPGRRFRKFVQDVVRGRMSVRIMGEKIGER